MEVDISSIDTLAEWGKLISISGHVPYLAGTLFVMWLWWPGARDALIRLWITRELSSYQWATVGVFFGFLAKDLDGSYWEGAWIASFYETWLGPILVDHGSVSNIVFRIMLGQVAVYCHVKGYKKRMDEQGFSASRADSFRRVMAYSSLVGVLTFFVLLLTHPGN